MTDQNQSSEPSAEGGSAPAKAKRKYTKKASKKVARKSAKKSAKKAAKKAVKGKTKVGRKGYDQDFKDKVLAFVKADPNRGIKAKAVKKFGVNSITLTSWLKAAGVKVNTKGGKAVKSAAKATGTGKRGRPSGSSNKVTGSKKHSPDTFENLVEEIRQTKAKLKDLVGRLAQAV